MLEIIKNTLTDSAMLGAIFSSVFIILLGYYLRRRNFINETAAKQLTSIVLKLSLPALAIKAFLKDINQAQLNEGMSILVWGFVIYITLILVTRLIYSRVEGDKRDVYRVLTVFGSTTFFGTPIVAAIYGSDGVMYSNIFNIAYRVFLYSYAFVKMSGAKLDRENLKENAKQVFLNPIIIATFLGIFIWIFQASLPQVDVVVGDTVKSYAFLRLDKTAPWLYKAIVYLAGLCSPLAWLSIGAKLAEVSMKEAVKQKDAWTYSLIKVLLVPTINLVLLIVLYTLGIMPVSFTGVATTVIMMAAPTATVAAAYAIGYDREAVFTSNCSLLSTIVAVVCTPVWIVILEIIRNAGIFG